MRVCSLSAKTSLKRNGHQKEKHVHFDDEKRHRHVAVSTPVMNGKKEDCATGERHRLLARSRHQSLLAVCGRILETAGMRETQLCNLTMSSATSSGVQVAHLCTDVVRSPPKQQHCPSPCHCTCGENCGTSLFSAQVDWENPSLHPEGGLAHLVKVLSCAAAAGRAFVRSMLKAP